MKKAHLNTLIGGLQIAAHCLADRLGVSLSIGGSQACTDGSTIRLPDLPEDREEAALLARGYLDHEAAHIRFTDFAIPSRPWLNLIEDIRIERRQGEEFPGCAINLRELVGYLKDQGHFRGNRRSPLSCLMAWASCRGRSRVLKQPLQEVAQEMEFLSRTLFGETFCNAFALCVEGIGACRSTADCEALARRIEDLLQHPPSPEDADQGSSSLAKPNEAAESPAEETVSGSETDSEPLPPGALRDSSSAQSKPRTEQEQKNLSRAAANDEVKSAESVDVGGILKKALDSEHRQACQQGRLVKIPGTHVAGESSSADIDQRACEKALGIDQVRRETAQLRARLAGLLQARRRQWAFPRSMGQRVDDRAVYRLGCTTPDLRIFASRRQQVAPDTAVLLLGDRSGSMHGPKMRLAQQSAYLTAEALELLPGVACAVGFFPWGEQVVRLKGFGEKLKTSHFTLSASGSTPMAEALLWAGMELTQRREPRKIVIVLTDGQPDEVEDAVAALEKLSACGIECYGIGIQDRSILTWMREGARTIEQSAELPGALVSVLQTLLVRRPGSVAA